MSLLDLMLRGGIIMWPILLCSLVSIAVAAGRILVLRKAGVDPREFMSRIRNMYRRGDSAGVLAICSQKSNPVANIIRLGILKQAHGLSQAREAIEGAGRGEIFRLERWLAFLQTMASATPMLGFLGTAIGLITAFATADAHHTLLSAPAVASGIWQALLPTAFGLAAGLVLHLLYNYCVARIGEIGHAMESASREFVEMLETKALLELHTRGEHQTPESRVLAYEEDEFFRRKR